MIDTSVCHVYFMLSVSEFVLNFLAMSILHLFLQKQLDGIRFYCRRMELDSTVGYGFNVC